jgi:hypothetical protein
VRPANWDSIEKLEGPKSEKRFPEYCGYRDEKECAGRKDKGIIWFIEPAMAK